MPTEIYFAGDNVRVEVVADPSQVAEAFASAEGLPFRLTGQGAQGDVYINPAMVAFWLASQPELERQLPSEPTQPATRRETVTDIWGQPIRRKPRR